MQIYLHTCSADNLYLQIRKKSLSVVHYPLVIRSASEMPSPHSSDSGMPNLSSGTKLGMMGTKMQHRNLPRRRQACGKKVSTYPGDCCSCREQLGRVLKKILFFRTKFLCKQNFNELQYYKRFNTGNEETLPCVGCYPAFPGYTFSSTCNPVKPKSSFIYELESI